MDKISFDEFRRIMAYDVVKNQNCIEVWFDVDNCPDYQESWLGKMVDKETKEPVYWFGLVEDGSQAYDYDSFEEFVDAKVFHNKSLREIWDSVSLISIDGCNVPERLLDYLG